MGGMDLLSPVRQAQFKLRRFSIHQLPPCQRLLSPGQKIAPASCPAASLFPGAERCHLSATTQVKKPGAADTDGRSPLPHVFAISSTARFGVAGSQQTTSSSLPHTCPPSRLPGAALHTVDIKEQRLRSRLGLEKDTRLRISYSVSWLDGRTPFMRFLSDTRVETLM